jgi:hypothetical protein
MSDGPDGRRRFRPGLVLWGLLALVGVVLMAQNTDQTRVRVFGFAVEMPLFLLIAVTMLLGWLLGTLGWWLFRKRQNRLDGRGRDGGRGGPAGGDAVQA